MWNEPVWPLFVKGGAIPGEFKDVRPQKQKGKPIEFSLVEHGGLLGEIFNGGVRDRKVVLMFDKRNVLIGVRVNDRCNEVH